MTRETFLRRLDAGKGNSYLYEAPGAEGMVSVWKHEGRYVLTWEECPPGGQYDESGYTRDERHLFDDAEDLLAFLARRGLPLDGFRP